MLLFLLFRGSVELYQHGYVYDSELILSEVMCHNSNLHYTDMNTAGLLEANIIKCLLFSYHVRYVSIPRVELYGDEILEDIPPQSQQEY